MYFKFKYWQTNYYDDKPVGDMVRALGQILVRSGYNGL